MSEIPNISEEYNYFQKLFENGEKEQNGDLYKKELYIMKEDLESNQYKTKLKLMHDALLQKFMCEEYTEFIPKNEVAQLIYPSDKKEAKNSSNDNKSTNKEDGVDKELLEEYEYLKELYRLNYLTFSPFALDRFDKMVNPNNKEEVVKEEQDEENKLMKILNFDYNSYEFNNDLLFNISQGFIDVSKLKESNIKEVDKSNKENSESDTSKNEDEDTYEVDEDLDHLLIEKTTKFVKNYEKNLFLKRAIVRFKDELTKLPVKCKNKVKNEFYKYWNDEFTKLEKDNERLMKRREDEKKNQQLLKQKMYLDRLKREKENEERDVINKENDFINELKKIQTQALRKSEIFSEKIKKDKKARNRNNLYKSITPIKNRGKYYCSNFNLYKEVLSKTKRWSCDKNCK